MDFKYQESSKRLKEIGEILVEINFIIANDRSEQSLRDNCKEIVDDLYLTLNKRMMTQALCNTASAENIC